MNHVVGQRLHRLLSCRQVIGFEAHEPLLGRAAFFEGKQEHGLVALLRDRALGRNGEAGKRNTVAGSERDQRRHGCHGGERVAGKTGRGGGRHPPCDTGKHN